MTTSGVERAPLSTVYSHVPPGGLISTVAVYYVKLLHPWHALFDSCFAAPPLVFAGGLEAKLQTY